MSDTIDIGSCFLSSTTATNCGGSEQTAITNIQVGAIGANAPSGTTLEITDGAGNSVASLALAIPSSLLASYTGPVLSLTNQDLPLAYVSSDVTVKLSSALSSGSLAINIGYTY